MPFPVNPIHSPDHGKGEAGILATYLSCGLADGTFDHSDSETEGAGKDGPDDPDVTVLFRWRTHMERYRQAFEAEGLTVADASTYLFDCPAVTAAIDVVEWLADPVDTARTRTLVTESALGLSTLEATLRHTTGSWTPSVPALRARYPPNNVISSTDSIASVNSGRRSGVSQPRSASPTSSTRWHYEPIPNDVAPRLRRPSASQIWTSSWNS